MGLIYKANGICYAGLQSWIYHIDEMKEYGLDNIPKFYSDLVVNSLEFKEKVSKNDRYFVFPKRKAVAGKLDIKAGHLPESIRDGIGKTGSVTLDMIIICYLLGFKTIYVLGMDCDYTAAKSHFYEGNTWDNHNAAPTTRHSIRYRLLKLIEMLDEKGVKCVQLSRGFNPITAKCKRIPTDRLENVIKGHVRPKSIGVLEEEFFPLDTKQIKIIAGVRKKADKIIAICKDKNTATVMAALRFVDDTIIQKGDTAFKKIKKLYPNDNISVYRVNGKKDII
jgi:hypothetical protein